MKYFKNFGHFDNNKPTKKIVENVFTSRKDLRKARREEDKNNQLLNESVKQAMEYFTANNIDLGEMDAQISPEIQRLRDMASPIAQEVKDFASAMRTATDKKEAREKIIDANKRLSEIKQKIAKAEEIEKNRASKTDNQNKKDFDYIVNMLKKDHDLIGQFVKFHFEQGFPLTSDDTRRDERNPQNQTRADNYFSNSLTDMYHYFKNNEKRLELYLPLVDGKHFHEYESFEFLSDHIIKSYRESAIKSVLKNFDTKQRNKFARIDDEIKDTLFEFSKLPKEYQSIVYGLKEDTLLEQKRKAFGWLTYTDTFPNEDVYTITAAIRKHIDKYNSNSTSHGKNEIREKLENEYHGKYDVVYDVDDVMIFASFDKALLRDDMLVSNEWCINYMQSSVYNSYVNPLYGMTTYIVHDLNKNPNDRYSNFGVMIRPDGEVGNANGQTEHSCQDKTNTQVPGKLSWFKENLNIPMDVWKPIYKDLPKYKTLIDSVVSYDDLKEALANVDDTDETGNTVKSILINTFDINRFARNIIINSNNWDDLLGNMKQIESEEKDFYISMRNLLNNPSIMGETPITDKLFSGNGLDNNDKSIEEIIEQYPFIKQMNVLLFSLYFNSGLDSIIEHVNPINHKIFAEKVNSILVPPSKEVLNKAVAYMKVDDGAVENFLTIFNDSLEDMGDGDVTQTENINNKIMNEIVADRHNYNNMKEYIEENPLLAHMIDKGNGFSYNFLNGNDLSFLIDFTIAMSKYKDSSIDGLKLVANDDKYFNDLLKAVANTISRSGESVDEVSNKMKKFGKITNHFGDNFNYNSDFFFHKLFSDYMLTASDTLPVELLDEVLKHIEII